MARSPHSGRTNLTDRAAANLVAKVLGDPTLFPDEFKAWLPRWLTGNVNLPIATQQLPTTQQPQVFGATNQPALQNGWVPFGGTNATPSYYKDLWLRVFLKGTVKSGTIATVIATLPAGYCPAEAEIFPVVSNGAFGVCTVNPDGTIVASSGSNVYFTLSGISFRAFS